MLAGFKIAVLLLWLFELTTFGHESIFQGLIVLAPGFLCDFFMLPRG